MKTILMIGLMGLATISGYAQNVNSKSENKNCVCVKKTAHHKTHHRKTEAVAVKKTKGPEYYTLIQEELIPLGSVPVTNSCVLDANGDIQYANDVTYLGYYPGIGSYPPNSDCDLDAYLTPLYKDLVITSTAFGNYGVMPAKYSCEGQQASPPLQVTNIPAGTQSLAIVMFDPYATAKKSATYWLMWNLDTTGFIPENFVSDHESVNPINKQYGYQGVCPLAGTHYYHFRVYALDTKLLLGKNTTQTVMENAMRGHVLAKGELIGQYNKRLD